MGNKIDLKYLNSFKETSPLFSSLRFCIKRHCTVNGVCLFNSNFIRDSEILLIESSFNKDGSKIKITVQTQIYLYKTACTRLLTGL